MMASAMRATCACARASAISETPCLVHQLRVGADHAAQTLAGRTPGRCRGRRASARCSRRRTARLARRARHPTVRTFPLKRRVGVRFSQMWLAMASVGVRKCAGVDQLPRRKPVWVGPAGGGNLAARDRDHVRRRGAGVEQDRVGMPQRDRASRCRPVGGRHRRRALRAPRSGWRKRPSTAYTWTSLDGNALRHRVQHEVHAFPLGPEHLRQLRGHRHGVPNGPAGPPGSPSRLRPVPAARRPASRARAAVRMRGPAPPPVGRPRPARPSCSLRRCPNPEPCSSVRRPPRPSYD